MGNLRCVGVIVVGLIASAAFAADADPALRHVSVIPLPGVEGRFDHLAVDVDNQRLFVSAAGNGTVEVIDLRAGAPLRSLEGLKEPQGMVYLPSLRRAVVADGGGAIVSLGDGASKKVDTLAELERADGVRFDADNARLYVGYGRGALAVFDPTGSRRFDDIKLPGHPEAFVLDGNSPSLYVNVPAKKSIVIIDRSRGEVVSTITLKTAAANYPMALDEAGHRLFVGTRKPARVVILDSRSGSILSSFACVADADDLFFDAARQRIYVSGGAGFVDVFDASPSGRNVRLAHVFTAAGARTSLWVPELRRLFVAAPGRGAEPAAIHVFEAPAY